MTTFTGIHVDDETLYNQIKDYVHEIAPEKESIVKLYTSNVPIFERFGIERQIKTSFGRTASMSKGAYLIIEHTEALHVIDVNSGNRSNKAKNQEDTALEVNMLAASEIARQLRLRDMGGIIVIDFIDMVKGDHRRKLYDHLRKEMKDDRAKHKILPPSKFGLVQITTATGTAGSQYQNNRGRSQWQRPGSGSPNCIDRKDKCRPGKNSQRPCKGKEYRSQYAPFYCSLSDQRVPLHSFQMVFGTQKMDKSATQGCIYLSGIPFSG